MPVEAKPLFRPDVLRPHVDGFTLPAHVDELQPTLEKWADLISSGKADTFNEKELLPDFFADIFGRLLGYRRPVDSSDDYTFSTEKRVEVAGEYADAVIGRFKANASPRYVVAVEGKGTKDPLDRPHAGRKMSAVDQAYRYAINLPCDWIIVTSIRQTRLYSKATDQQTYERFDTASLAKDERQLRRFLFLLGADRVVPETGECHLYSLRTKSEKAGKELTKDYYVEYANIRQDIFEKLADANPDEPRTSVLAATQKLLDRVLFIAFAEDRELLPDDSLAKAYEHRDDYNPRPIWDNYRGLFRWINEGYPPRNIPLYNGGLFADDPVLDRLNVPDAVCDHFNTLGGYNYNPALVPDAKKVGKKNNSPPIDVDILGSIFEQSITDLEKLRNELEGLTPPLGPEKHKTRRKKEGAFYTPAFITRYIVEQTLGSVLRDRFNDLRQRHARDAKGAAKESLADPRVYDLPKLKKTQQDALIQFWEAWQDELATVRILDPACGSGAFLLEAFDQLHAEYDSTNQRLNELEARKLGRSHRVRVLGFDIDRSILQNNLYGVDLNSEAVDICRLSLWIKTATRGQVLTSLDHTICEGNSVVSDPDIHARAFNWRTAFPEVFADGGFDVVVGNPPYIRQEWLAPYKPHWQQAFASYHGTADIFTYFYELGVGLLRDGGRLGFITSGSWVRSNFGGPLRGFIARNVRIESLIDFGEYQPFEAAEMIRPTIMVTRKDQPGGSLKLFKWLTKGKPPENLSDVIAESSSLTTSHLNDAAWELESDAVRSLREKMISSKSRLCEIAGARLFRGCITGLTEAYVVDQKTRDSLIRDDPSCGEYLKPFLRGQDVLPWNVDEPGLWLIVIPSSGDKNWPWSESGNEAERIFASTLPSIHAHLKPYQDRLEQRNDKGRFWWELRSCAYWSAFDRAKVIWPDIAKLPRFVFDERPHYVSNTSYFLSDANPYIFGLLASWATWFLISKTAQPLRLRGDRWQYRLFTQYMEQIPIPNASAEDRELVGTTALIAAERAGQMYQTQRQVQHRLSTAFRPDNPDGGELNQAAQAWWEQSLTQLGNALKTSFKLPRNPFTNPRTADEWEPYLSEQRNEVQRLASALADAEAELNERVYRLFDLTPDEVQLLQREVEH